MAYKLGYNSELATCREEKKNLEITKIQSNFSL